MRRAARQAIGTRCSGAAPPPHTMHGISSLFAVLPTPHYPRLNTYVRNSFATSRLRRARSARPQTSGAGRRGHASEEPASGAEPRLITRLKMMRRVFAKSRDRAARRAFAPLLLLFALIL